MTRFHLQHVPLDTGGYDRGGAYWGLGDPLYWYGPEENFDKAPDPAPDVPCAYGAPMGRRSHPGNMEGYFRALTRDAAKREILRDIEPDATFFDGPPKAPRLHLEMHSTLDASELPAQCIEECSASGDVTAAVEKWCAALGVTVDEDDARTYVRAFGLEDDEDRDLAGFVLWQACCQIHEDGLFCMEY